MAKKEKQKVVVWMSRDTKTGSYEFWSKRPMVRSRQYYDKAEKGGFRLSLTRLASACGRQPERILAPIKLKTRGLIKLTITAERIE